MPRIRVRKKTKQKHIYNPRSLPNDIAGNISLSTKTIRYGLLDLENSAVKNSLVRILDELLQEDSLEHTISKIIFFVTNPNLIEMPITTTIDDSIVYIHPGRTRFLASFLSGEKTIESLFVNIIEDEKNINKMESISKKLRRYKKDVYEYKSENHNAISLEQYKEYYYPTDKKLNYELEIKQSARKRLKEFMPIKLIGEINYNFGEGEPKTIVECKNSLGVFQSLLYLATDKGNSSNFVIVV